jgi:5-methylcytosine-specific restriction endonuclease McrA
MADRLISRAEAKAQGLTTYFTGKPCLHGHIAKRVTRNKHCVACKAVRRLTLWDREDLVIHLAKLYGTGEYITRDDAVRQGLKRYFTGIPCKQNGHIAERFVSTRACVDCMYAKLSKSPWTKEESLKRAARRRLRSEAIAAGKTTYSVAEPCDHGHTCERRTLDSKCIDCVAERAAARKDAWSKLHPEKRRAISLRWRTANPELYRESSRLSKERNRKKHTEAQKADYAKNPEKYRAARKRYYNKKRAWHIERAALNDRKRRAQKKGSGGSHTAADLRAIITAQGHQCANCRADLRKVRKHVDHIVPLARGGSNDRRNLQYLCAPCNLAKGAKDPIEFARAQGRLL